MGTLVVKRYRTTLFARLADHTYVECGTGMKAWSCWGGKTGGDVLRQGRGSTKRADAIAGPKERAGITCYLINGVCHQAANRILLPAGVTVRGARGYGLSEALFGPYGRPRGFLGACKAPFEQHPKVKGDLPECRGRAPKGGPDSAREGDPPEYLERVRMAYTEIESEMVVARGVEDEILIRFAVTLFGLQVEHRLAGGAEGRRGSALRDIRLSFERSRLEMERSAENEEWTPVDLAAAFERESETFQNELANVLSPDDYAALLDAEPGDLVTLADPEIVNGLGGVE